LPDDQYLIDFPGFFCEIAGFDSRPKYYPSQSEIIRNTDGFLKKALIWCSSRLDRVWRPVDVTPSERTSKKVIFDESKAELVTFGLPTGEERKAFVDKRCPDACTKWAHDYLSRVSTYTAANHRDTYPNGRFHLNSSVRDWRAIDQNHR
jgi:hypothetical protein